jgi:hypothetical protein
MTSFSVPAIDHLMIRLGKSRVTPQSILTNDFQQCAKYDYPNVEVISRHKIDLVKVAASYARSHEPAAAVLCPPKPILSCLDIDQDEFIKFVETSKIKVCTGKNRIAMLNVVRSGVTVDAIIKREPDVGMAMAHFLSKNLVIFDSFSKSIVVFVVDKRVKSMTTIPIRVDSQGKIVRGSLATLGDATRSLNEA